MIGFYVICGSTYYIIREGVLVMRMQPSGSKSGTDCEARFNCNRQPEVEVLEKAFAGIPAGA
jgi:hypothetical protein